MKLLKMAAPNSEKVRKLRKGASESQGQLEVVSVKRRFHPWEKPVLKRI